LTIHNLFVGLRPEAPKLLGMSWIVKIHSIMLVGGLLFAPAFVCAGKNTSLPIQVVPAKHGGNVNVTTVIVDLQPPDSTTIGYLEKAIGHFTNAPSPSIIIVEVNCSSVRLYQNFSPLSGAWAPTTLNVGAIGNPQWPYCYERARPIKFAGDTYDNLVLSTGDTVSILLNPANSGQDATTAQWQRVIITNRGSHDIKIADIDGDGKLDIIASGSVTLHAYPNFIAYQNSPTDWQVVNGPLGPDGASMGDGIAVANVRSRVAIVGASTSDGNLYWSTYPGSRTGAWTPHVIASADSGVSLAASSFINGVSCVVMAANELIGSTPGLRVFTPHADPTQPWNQTVVNGTFQAVHEINVGSWNGSNYIIAAEQQQACSGTDGFHGPPCRMTLFQTTDNGASWVATPLDTQDVQNQQTIQFGSDLLVTGLGFSDAPAVKLWVISP
jgi:hypothetical protein